MTIIRNTGVEEYYSKGEKLPLLWYKDVWVRFFPTLNGSWEKDKKKDRYWYSLDMSKTTILVPKEFT